MRDYITLIDFTDEFLEAHNLLEKIPKDAKKAAARAFNRALITGRAAATKEVTSRYTVRTKDVKSTFWMHKATEYNLRGTLISTGRSLPLRAFAHRPTTDTTGAKRRPIRITVMSGEVHTFPTAFVWRNNIFRRLGGKRLPISKLMGPSVPSMIGNTDIVDEVQNIMVEVAEKRLEHELSRLVEGKK